MTDHLRLLAEHVVTPTGVLDDAVIDIEGPRLVSIHPRPTGPGPGPCPGPGPGPERVSGWVVPGFVDTHVHGGGGFDYATTDPRAAVQGRSFHASHGTTTSFASLVSAPVEVLCGQLSMLADLVADGHFAGIHLEGPFLSPRKRGAHDPAALRNPDAESVQRLLVAGRGALSMVTVAPELPGALPAIRQLLDAGVVVAIGHTDADAETVQRAVDAGASTATHLFNAMGAIHHRDPGPVPVLTGDPRVHVELIADGFHLHPGILRLASAAAGPRRTVLVTDAMVAAGMPDGAFSLGGLRVSVRGAMARLVDDEGKVGSIAGSTLTMDRAFAVMTEIVGDIPTVAAMSATNAAQHFGLADVGRIEPGALANLCVVDERGVLQRVLQAGLWRTDVARQ